MRYEWLSQYLFDSIEEVQEFATKWLWTYNHERPNMALGGITLSWLKKGGLPDMLNGKLDFLLGSRLLASLSFKIPKMNTDPDFRKFIGIASETDDFPLGKVQQFWDAKALEKLAPKMKEAEAWARKTGEPACQSLITRFSKKQTD